jgi:membrane protease YdiL (CAAX protease family)
MWRIPLAVGLVFSLAHFWTPARIPGTIIPIQMVLVFPAGFFCAFYFLKFRNILPLTAIHAIAYVLLHNWVEVHL